MFIKLLDYILQRLRNFDHALLGLILNLVEPFEHFDEIWFLFDEIYWLLIWVTAVHLIFRASGAAHTE